MTNWQNKMTSKSSDRLIKLVVKFVKSVIKTNNKVHKLLTYNEAINNLIHKNK